MNAARLAAIEAAMRAYLIAEPTLFTCTVDDPDTLLAVATAMGASWMNAHRVVDAHALLVIDLATELQMSGSLDHHLATLAGMLFDWLDAAGYVWHGSQRRMVLRDGES